MKLAFYLSQGVSTIEKAFTLSHDCELYRQYQEYKTETQKSHNFARAFFAKYALMESNGQYVMGNRLRITMSDDLKEKYDGQLMKNSVDGLSVFKKNSTIQKAWEEEVAALVDFKKIDAYRGWYFPYIHHGSYSLWGYGDEVYGYLKEKNGEPTLPDGAAQIKMSEYYAAYEEAGGEK